RIRQRGVRVVAAPVRARGGRDPDPCGDRARGESCRAGTRSSSRCGRAAGDGRTGTSGVARGCPRARRGDRGRDRIMHGSRCRRGTGRRTRNAARYRRRRHAAGADGHRPGHARHALPRRTSGPDRRERADIATRRTVGQAVSAAWVAHGPWWNVRVVARHNVDMNSFSRPGAVDLSGLASGASGEPGSPAAAGAYSFEATEQTFQSEVAEASMQYVVVLSLWSPRAPESVTLNETLSKLADSYQGRLVVARLDV